jgi:hypothetical protein
MGNGLPSYKLTAMAYKTNSGNGPFPSYYRACMEFRVDRSSFRSTLLIVGLLTSMTERCLACIGLPRTNRLSHVLSLGCDTRSIADSYGLASVDRRDSTNVQEKLPLGAVYPYVGTLPEIVCRTSLEGPGPNALISHSTSSSFYPRLPFKVKSLTLIPYGNYPERRDFVPR